MFKNGAFENEPKSKRVFTFIRLNPYESFNSKYPPDNTLAFLRDSKINYFLPVEQIYRIKLNTKTTQNDYLTNFGNNYQKLFENLIDQFVQNNPENEQKILFDDVLFHLNFIRANKLNEIPTTTQSILKVLVDYVLDDKNDQPLILAGSLGCGKSSLISTFTSNLFLQLFVNDGQYECDSAKHSIVIRFIGIDGKSIYLRGLLKSICNQLRYINKSTSSTIDPPVPNKLTDLKKYFKNILIQNSSDTRKIIIILDSLQDLTRNDNSYKLDWLPQNLGKNCKVILSLSSESTELIKRLRRKYTNENSYVTMSHLNKEQGEYMVRKLLAQKNYRLDSSQANLVSNLIQEKRVLSLHLKLLSEGEAF